MPSATAIDSLKEELELVERRAEALRQALAILQGEAMLVAYSNTPLPLRADFSGLGIVDAATRFVKELGEPQDTRAIADGLQARGLKTKSKNFTAAVYATLHNSKSFKRTKDDKWEPIDQEERG